MSTRRSRQGSLHHPKRFTISAMVVLGLLLVIPAYALSRFATWIDWRLLVGGPLAISAFTFFSYRSDKRRAEARAWRIPESMLPRFCEHI